MAPNQSETLVVGAEVWPAIRTAAEGPGKRLAAVAYIGADGAALLSNFGRGDMVVCDASRASLRSGSTDPNALAELVARGVAVYSCEGLHAKVYVLGKTTIVGSANASMSSASRLLEAATVSTAVTTVDAARQFVLDTIKGANTTAVGEAFLDAARHTYRRPRMANSGAAPTGGGAPPPTTLRLHVEGFVDTDPPAAVDAHIRAQRRRARAAAGPAAAWAIDVSWDPDPRWARAGDWVLWVNEGGSPYEVWPPMEVLERTPVGGRSRQIVTWMRAPARLRPLKWDAVVGTVLARSGRRLAIGRRLTDAAAVRAVFGAWKLEAPV